MAFLAALGAGVAGAAGAFDGKKKKPSMVTQLNSEGQITQPLQTQKNYKSLATSAPSSTGTLS